MTARSSSHPPPRDTSRVAQKTTNSLQNSYRPTYIRKDGADTTTGHKNEQDALQHNYSRQAEKLSFYNV